MRWPFCEGTQDLFDRAERAINRSKELIEQADIAGHDLTLQLTRPRRAALSGRQ
jgi:hypothetical protein